MHGVRIKNLNPYCAARSLVTILTELPRLFVRSSVSY